MGEPRSGCGCGPQSGCKTKRCECVVGDVSCRSDCGCGKECTRRGISGDTTGEERTSGGVSGTRVGKKPPSTAEPTSCRCRSECTPGSCKCVDLDIPCNTSCGCGGCQQKYPLRDKVHDLTDEIWTYRGGVDVYTKLSRKKYQAQGTTTENDHVWEVQILEDARGSLGPAYNTRAMTNSLKTIVNHVCNLNVTDHRINQAKKGPFTTWRNCYNDGNPISFDDAIERTSSVYGKTEMKDKGYWSNIKREVVNTYDKMTDYLHDPGQILDYRPPKGISKVADELERRLAALKVD